MLRPSENLDLQNPMDPSQYPFQTTKYRLWNGKKTRVHFPRSGLVLQRHQRPSSTTGYLYIRFHTSLCVKIKRKITPVEEEIQVIVYNLLNIPGYKPRAVKRIRPSLPLGCEIHAIQGTRTVSTVTPVADARSR